MISNVSISDCMRDAVDLLLKASGYLDFCVQDVLVHLPPDVKYVKICSALFQHIYLFL